MICADCGEKITLPKVGEEVAVSHSQRGELVRQTTIVRQRTAFETSLVRIKGFVRDRGDAQAPTCFISYAWGVPEHERWVMQFARDLQNTGIAVILDHWDNAAVGMNVARFVSRITDSDFIAVVGTPRYLHKYENKDPETGYVVAAEVDLINQRLLGTESQKKSVLPLLLAGTEATALPPLLCGRVYSPFLEEKLYFSSLFDLVLTLYRIPFNGPAVIDLREQMRLELDL